MEDGIMTDWDSIVARLAAASVTVDAALTTAKAAKHNEERRPPLPAPALTEQAIVDALKADPAMAGRVIVALADGMPGVSRERCQSAAYAASEHPQRHRSLQSLAVALAAASYRG